MKKYNAAVYLLSGRVNLLEKCLSNFFKNWNNKYQYPVFVHYFGNIYSKNFIKTLESAAAGLISLSYMRDAVSSIKKTRQNIGHTSPDDNILANAINSGNLSNVINSWHTLDSNTLIPLYKGLIEKVTVSDDSIDIKLKHF